MHYYKRNLGDYAKKAGRLSMLQHGAYTLLIDACYDRERFPSLDEAIEWTWASSTAEVEAVEFVLRKFFTLVDGVYIQTRIQDEVDEYRKKAIKSQKSASERWNKNANRIKNDANRIENDATVMRPLCDRNATVMRNNENQQNEGEINEKTAEKGMKSEKTHTKTCDNKKLLEHANRIENDANRIENDATVMRPLCDSTAFASKTVHNQEPLTRNQEPRTILKPLKPLSAIASQTETKTEDGKTEKTITKGCKLPQDWTLPDSCREWVYTEKPSMIDEDIDAAVEAFRDYWHANSNQARARKANWEAAFRSWIRNMKPTNWKSNSPPPTKQVFMSADERRKQVADAATREFLNRKRGTGTGSASSTADNADFGVGVGVGVTERLF